MIEEAVDTNGVLKINSSQNGMLHLSDIHHMFDQYTILANADDSYKVVDFDEDYLRLDGRVLDPVCRDPHNVHRVSDELLRWHYSKMYIVY
ncbi:hypothetical protein L211DRAFT_834466 [Terfezia boudieri ATCC MYA-4762]|uniref:HNH nuclease domain-containing protein n=1 Tax=Terfezia boudieri ATCC MYA-4762 TaxID=1051890 RepID=A0A3N4MEV0_9PEZI|nr:hypothetical protein L211DRAFT_834466 [Terfezia boudieri ATCC MYA-4762]